MWFPVALVTPTDFTPIPPCKTKENNNKRDIYKYDLIRCQLVLNENKISEIFRAIDKK